MTNKVWHIAPCAQSSDTPDFVYTWPPHGVAGTAEAELHPALTAVTADAAVKKGSYSAAYSGFEGVDAEGRSLGQILTAAEITAVDVVGLAESQCVKDTALEAVRDGQVGR